MQNKPFLQWLCAMLLRTFDQKDGTGCEARRAHPRIETRQHAEPTRPEVHFSSKDQFDVVAIGTEEQVSEGSRKSIYLSKIAPEDIRQYMMLKRKSLQLRIGFFFGELIKTVTTVIFEDLMFIELISPVMVINHLGCDLCTIKLLTQCGVCAVLRMPKVSTSALNTRNTHAQHTQHTQPKLPFSDTLSST